MKSTAKNATVVKHDKQIAKRTNFTWIFPPGQNEICIIISTDLTIHSVKVHSIVLASSQVNLSHIADQDTHDPTVSHCTAALEVLSTDFQYIYSMPKPDQVLRTPS